jgi:choloylglycine hydrolase
MSAPRIAVPMAMCVASFVAVMAGRADACTAFLLEGGSERVVGKSYDWQMGQGLVLVNKHGVAKRALTVDLRDAPASWVSRHASVTFNQFGREFPNGGMNDAGLVVEILWLDASRYERRDARPALNELQWIQYQLDSFATVADMTAAAPGVRISPVYANVHYFACDKGGACAAFEWLGGKLRITHGARVLTNHSHAESVAWTAAHRQPPKGMGSLERFARTSRAVATPPRGEVIPAAFSVLDGVRGGASQWNIVYDLGHLRVHFRTQANAQIRSIELAKLAGGCASPVQMLDIDTGPAGNATERLAVYSGEVNRRLVERSLRPMAQQVPAGAAQLLARYPSTLACAPVN